MNKLPKSLTVAECKIQASLLLKSLRSEHIHQAEKAAKRLKRLPEFTTLSSAEIMRTDIKRKHALAVIALEKGFNSWAELKIQIPFIIGGFLNKWFADYAEAKTHLQLAGGYLLPYKKQFFICSADYIKQLGFNPADPDWQLIDYDWIHPADKKAWQRLYNRWSQINANH